jgi:formyl-CoA transferase
LARQRRSWVSIIATAGLVLAQAPSIPKLLSSEDLAKQPQTPGATGDQERHYYFAEAANEMPFRLYVPLKWNRQTKLPMIVALHGAFGTHDTMLTAAQGIVKTLAEQHGYIVVSPLGYGPLGGYGQHYDIGMRAPREGSSEEEQSMQELAEEPSLRATGTVVEVDHPTRGPYLTVGNPIKLSDSPADVRRSPLLGEHTDEVLRVVLRYSDKEISAIKASGALSAPEKKAEAA